jgi:hypothetical protein
MWLAETWPTPRTKPQWLRLLGVLFVHLLESRGLLQAQRGSVAREIGQARRLARIVERTETVFDNKAPRAA